MKENSIFKKEGLLPGKTVAIFAGIHGNETVGLKALDVLQKELTVKAGVVYLVYGNPPAIDANKRFIEKNLNRLFTSENIGTIYEDVRARELMKILDSCDALLDLHSYNSNEGEAFAICEKNAYDLVGGMDLTIVMDASKIHGNSGIGYINSRGKIGLTLECGTTNMAETFLPMALKSAYQFLRYFGCVDREVENTPVKKKFIQAEKVIYKQNEEFAFVKEFKDFEKLLSDELFAFDGKTPIFAGKNDLIVFPRPNVPVGGEVCIIAREIISEPFETN